VKVALVGPVDGNLTIFYEILKQCNVEWALCTGNLGVWIDKERVDRATRHKNKQGDFGLFYAKGLRAPVRCLFVAGAHEDHRWLSDRFKQNKLEILPNVTLLANGFKTTIGDTDEAIRITGLGKVYSEQTYNGKINRRSFRHYTKDEVNLAKRTGKTDILLLHSGPREGKGINEIVKATNPKLIVHSSNSKREQYSYHGIPTIPLSYSQITIIETSSI
jgi:hypothetical protein